MHSQLTAEQPQTHSSFEWIKSEKIESLNVVVEQYRHKKTQASHYHIHSDSDENVFLVALRTVPEDSTGVAHVLEHTALCGSQKFPVRDPFFMMIRRSLNTFMNAFTSSDWTAYPFASKNKKDFGNLLEVYLDAVFFSNLNPLDFAQEGHRVEFSEADNIDSELVRKGVVFNEMKGAMSSITSALWQSIYSYIFPTNTYHYNSGGEPSCIPDLTYEQLKSFYETHYHPSNSIFMTFGDIPAIDHQENFDKLALSKFEYSDVLIRVPEEKRYFAPIKIEESYPLNSEDLSNKSHINVAWLLGKSTDIHEVTIVNLVSSVLLENSASPLRHALETSDLGLAPSPLCGLDDSNKEMTFICGLEGCDPKALDKVEALILDTLQKIAEVGVDQELIESSLHQLELSQREVGGDGYPYGLQLILTGLSLACHDGDPVESLNIDSVLAKLRSDIQNPDFIKESVKRLFLQNPHRISHVFSPDDQLERLKEEHEKHQLSKLKDQLTEEQKRTIVTQTHALNARQMQEDDESILPKVGIDDIPSDLYIAEGNVHSIEGNNIHCYEQGTNGLVYQQVAIHLPNLSENGLKYLPYFSACLPELGLGTQSYLEVQSRQSLYTGGISTFTNIRAGRESEQDMTAYFIASSKSLVKNYQSMNTLVQSTLFEPRFDEKERISELFSQIRSRKEQSLTNSGHIYAMKACCSGMSPIAKLNHQQNGLESLSSIKEICDALETPSGMEKIESEFTSIHKSLLDNTAEILLVAEPTKMPQILNEFQTNPLKYHSQKSSMFELSKVRHQVKQIWSGNTQINFCALAYPTVPSSHSDAPALSVLGNVLRNGYLHRAIREQGGAYGAGASQDNNSASFRFYSYRDPRIEGTLQDFQDSIQWCLKEGFSDAALEEAVLGLISSIDKPSSPAGEAKSSFHQYLAGRTSEQRRIYRDSILKVSADDLVRVASQYFDHSHASTAILTSKKESDRLRNLFNDYQFLDL